MECKICNNVANNNTIKVKEMMFGTKEEFEYMICNNCRCAQLVNVPDDMSKYYPKKFYSLRKNDFIIRNNIIRNLKKIRYLTYLNIPVPFKDIFKKAFHGRGFYDWISYAKITFDENILDIGSGTGSLINGLYNEGFKNLTGIDPFIEKDIIINEKIKIFKKDIFQFDNRNKLFDFIIVNHVFEHIEGPLRFLLRLRELIKPGKYILVRIPFLDSYAFEKYKENWVQFDAPRHIFLYGNKSIDILANKANLQIVKIFHQSTDFQFTGSELYLKGISRLRKDDYKFSKDELLKFRELSKELNKKKYGDEVAVYLKHNESRQT